MPFLRSCHREIFKRVALSLVVPLCFLSFITHAQGPTEQQVKAVYIYNFVNFVNWPNQAFNKSSAPLVIGIAGSETYLALVKELVKGETHDGRAIDVRNVDKIDQAKECHMLFIDSHCEITKELIAETRGNPTLTVSDTEDFMQDGGMIRFFLDDNKVKIEINQKLSADHGLQISSKLLRLSKVFSAR